MKRKYVLTIFKKDVGEMTKRIADGGEQQKRLGGTHRER